jgi:hypothetical protein
MRSERSISLGSKSNGLSFGVLLLALLCAFSFGAIVRVATADVSYHVNCVGHGFVGGDAPNDGSFFARVDGGCGSPYRECAIYSYGVWRGGQSASATTICNSWSRTWGEYTECAGSAYAYSQGVFSAHFHYAPNRCF